MLLALCRTFAYVSELLVLHLVGYSVQARSHCERSPVFLHMLTIAILATGRGRGGEGGGQTKPYGMGIERGQGIVVRASTILLRIYANDIPNIPETSAKAFNVTKRFA